MGNEQSAIGTSTPYIENPLLSAAENARLKEKHQKEAEAAKQQALQKKLGELHGDQKKSTTSGPPQDSISILFQDLAAWGKKGKKSKKGKHGKHGKHDKHGKHGKHGKYGKHDKKGKNDKKSKKSKKEKENDFIELPGENATDRAKRLKKWNEGCQSEHHQGFVAERIRAIDHDVERLRAIEGRSIIPGSQSEQNCTKGNADRQIEGIQATDDGQSDADAEQYDMIEEDDDVVIVVEEEPEDNGGEENNSEMEERDECCSEEKEKNDPERRANKKKQKCGKHSTASKGEANLMLPSSLSMQKVRFGDLKKWQKEVLASPKNRLAMATLSGTDMKQLFLSKDVVNKQLRIFNTKIPLEGAPITNQVLTGLCWLFAATNIFRIALMKRHNLAKFELSQAYLFFYDKIEKANYYLETIQMLGYANQVQAAPDGQDALDGKGAPDKKSAPDELGPPIEMPPQVQLEMMLSGAFNPVQDGGHWDLAINLVEKYGLCPHVLYPGTYSAHNAASMDFLLLAKLKEDALLLLALIGKGYPQQEVLAAKEKMMKEVHMILTLALGPPPAPDEKFTWNFIDAAKKPQKVTTTPIAFANELNSLRATRMTGSNIHRMVTVVSFPHKGYNKLLIGPIFSVGGRNTEWFNVPIKVVKTACIAMLKAGLPVMFSCDAERIDDIPDGIMDVDALDYQIGFDVQFKLDKANRLKTGLNNPNHAMVLTAVHLDKHGNSVRWKVQNSWGKDKGTCGWFVMTDRWMDEYVYGATVDLRFVAREVKAILEGGEMEALSMMDPVVRPPRPLTGRC